MNSNQLTIVIVENILVEKEPKVLTNHEIPEEQVTLEKGYYHGIYVILNFKKEVDVESKEDQADVEYNTDEEEMDDVNLDNEREHHWMMVSKKNDGGVDNAQALLHVKRWDVYENRNKKAG